MITLTIDQQISLKEQFRFASDRDLVFELARRGRLREINASAAFWTEMREQDGYMDAVKSRALRRIAQILPTLTPKAVIEGQRSRPAPGSEAEHGDTPKNMTHYHASVYVLVARDRERDDG